MNIKKLFIPIIIISLVGGCASGKYSNVKNLYTAAGTTLVCFGDSLTSGYGAPPGSDYPSLLAQELPLPVINAGIPGDTAAAAISRIEDVLSKDPKIVIVELGANDILRTMGGKETEEITFRNLATIIDRVQEYGAVVVLAGISINYELEQRYKKLAKEKGAVLIPNIMEGILGDQSLMADFLHPNAQGYKVMAETFLRVLKPLLQEMQ